VTVNGKTPLLAKLLVAPKQYLRKLAINFYGGNIRNPVFVFVFPCPLHSAFRVPSLSLLCFRSPLSLCDSRVLNDMMCSVLAYFCALGIVRGL
jgi:hypothetical protein